MKFKERICCVSLRKDKGCVRIQTHVSQWEMKLKEGQEIVQEKVRVGGRGGEVPVAQALFWPRG